MVFLKYQIETKNLFQFPKKMGKAFAKVISATKQHIFEIAPFSKSFLLSPNSYRYQTFPVGRNINAFTRVCSLRRKNRPVLGESW